jgi:hypothetical protein
MADTAVPLLRRHSAEPDLAGWSLPAALRYDRDGAGP